MDTQTPMLSVVVPAFNEQDNLPVLYERLSAALEPLNGAWELIVVDDHSADGTFDVLTDLAARYPHVRAVRMARNSGSHNAAMCAFEHVRGDAIVLLAADLQIDRYMTYIVTRDVKSARPDIAGLLQAAED